ncbi:MAG: histidine phosphatase family protein [Planctomycetota bacterium]
MKLTPHPNISLTLIRHGEVDPAMKKICYGQMDVPLSEHGRTSSLHLASTLASKMMPDRIVYSGRSRTRFLAEAFSQALDHKIQPKEDRRLLERDYGTWQGKTWDKVFESDPDHFHDLIEKPDSYRPPGGETTTEMKQRICQWYKELSEPNDDALAGTFSVIAITHSGPLTALAGSMLGLHPRDWRDWFPPTLGTIEISASSDRPIQRSW